MTNTFVSTALPSVTAASAAVFGGAMFAFSSFVMPALKQLPPAEGISAMQSINDVAPRSLLMLPMGALALGSVAVLGTSLSAPDRGLRIAGAALGIAAIAITVGANVPLNDRLAALPAAGQSTSQWLSYVTSWTAWNHARTLSSLGSAALLTMAAARATGS